MEHLKITETELWAYISKTTDDETIQKVEKWMNSPDFDEALFIKTTKLYNITFEEDVAVTHAKNKFFNTVKPKRVIWKEMLKYAAILVAVISGVYSYNNITSNKNQIIVETTFGEQKNIILSDGSTVWLNASSTLSYNAENPRKLYLEGEGFFDVAKDKLHPFTVTTPDHITVKALGTSFNVKSYADSPTTETKLLTGKVEVSSSKYFKNKLLMAPNDKVVFHKKNKEIVKSIMDYNESTISWKEGKIKFINKTFKEIALDLKAQFDIKIKFKNVAIANSKFTGSFENTTPIADIFEILKVSRDFNYQLNVETNEWMIK